MAGLAALVNTESTYAHGKHVNGDVRADAENLDFYCPQAFPSSHY